MNIEFYKLSNALLKQREIIEKNLSELDKKLRSLNLLPPIPPAPTAEEISKIFTYFQEHKQDWDRQLERRQDPSLFLRKNDTKLPYSIEYTKEKQLILYTRIFIDSGSKKKAYLAAELVSQKLFVHKVISSKDFYRKKSYDLETIKKEHNLLQEFQNIPGIVPYIHTGHYTSKDNATTGLRLVELHYTCTLANLHQYLIASSEIDIKKIIYKIVSCLDQLHKRNFVHNDIKKENILIQIDENTHQISDIALFDLERGRKYTNNIDDNINAKKRDVFHLCHIIKYLATQLSLLYILPDFLQTISRNGNESLLVKQWKHSTEDILNMISDWKN